VDNFLEFERPIEELSAKIDELERVSQTQNIDLGKRSVSLKPEDRKLPKIFFPRLILGK